MWKRLGTSSVVNVSFPPCITLPNATVISNVVVVRKVFLKGLVAVLLPR